ncbi:MAG TPA: S41 family peptidase [Thermoanaerobaculia bacterium]|jgi:hypothetical protein
MRLLLVLLLAADVSAASRAPVIESIARQIEKRYVIVDEAPRIAQRLRADVAKYESIEDNAKLAEALGNDLRQSTGDLHFDVRFDPAHAERLLAAGSDTKRVLPEVPPTPEQLAEMRRTNYGVRRYELLDGNVANIELTLLEKLQYSRTALTAALELAANAEAVVIDLRGAPGGRPETVRFLASYFLAKPTLLLSTFDRETGKTTESYSMAGVAGRRMPDVPLFILTGTGTGSAAEGFAFVMQQLGRAAIVGEHSQGAAYGGGWVPAAEGFVVFIPTFRPVTKNGKTWHATGVIPDVPAPADRALAMAHLRAVAALDARASRPELRWLLPLLDLAANGPKSGDARPVAGKYQGVEITREPRFIGASGMPRELTPLSDGTFLIEDFSVAPRYRARVRFTATGLELLTPQGRVIPRPRLPD